MMKKDLKPFKMVGGEKIINNVTKETYYQRNTQNTFILKRLKTFEVENQIIDPKKST